MRAKAKADADITIGHQTEIIRRYSDSQERWHLISLQAFPRESYVW